MSQQSKVTEGNLLSSKNDGQLLCSYQFQLKKRLACGGVMSSF